MPGGIRLASVSFRYGAVTILDRETLVVEPGRAVVITGDNGVGKSTLLYVAAGLLPVAEGRVWIHDREAGGDDPTTLFRAGVRVGFVFQQGGLVSNLDALGNVKLALGYHADALGLDDGAIDRRARAALREARVASSDVHATPAHLSFGARKRVALARALALEPNVVFLDDPDAGLDPETATILHDLLVRFRDDPNVTMMIASNHRELLERLESPAFELVAGRLVEGFSRSVA